MKQDLRGIRLDNRLDGPENHSRIPRSNLEETVTLYGSNLHHKGWVSVGENSGGDSFPDRHRVVHTN